MAAIDSPVGSPITPAIIDLKDAYRDPTRFRSSAMESLIIQPVKMINLLNDKQGNQMLKISIHMLSLRKQEVVELEFLLSLYCKQ